MLVDGNIEAPEWMSTPEKRAYRQGYQQALVKESTPVPAPPPAPSWKSDDPPRPLYVFVEGFVIGSLGMLVLFSSCGGWQ